MIFSLEKKNLVLLSLFIILVNLSENNVDENNDIDLEEAEFTGNYFQGRLQ